MHAPTPHLLPLATALLAIGTNLAHANPLQVFTAGMDSTLPIGTNPIVNPKVEYLGFQYADNSCSHRDLGFTGSIAGKWYAVWGDVLWCDAGVTDPEKDTPGFHGMVRDAVSVMTKNPLIVHDLNLGENGRQKQFIPFNSSWGEKVDTGFGGTSLVETNAETRTGAVFYLVNQNADGLVGAGIAKVDVLFGTPTVTKRYGDRGYWWDAKTTPRYGDIAAFRDPCSEYIYAWGGPPTTITDWGQSSYVYLARVNASQAFNVSNYEYYWGRQQGWKSDVLTTFNSQTATVWGTGQGQIVWNEHFKCYIFVHLGIGGGTVFLRTATKLEGPWTPDIKIFQAQAIDGGLVYAGVAHPYLDPTGKTLVISFTNNNRIQVIKVTVTRYGCG